MVAALADLVKTMPNPNERSPTTKEAVTDLRILGLMWKRANAVMCCGSLTWSSGGAVG
jgi:hypothetical protein